ncbi:MAG: TetR family transcriptional regulator [Marmoricola sp.]|nr:TetR family transcriptional regulator [Marmoricola sp.]
MLQATAELVVERGVEGASLAEIGRRAGYSHSLVHHRFGSKDALIERLNTEAVATFSDATAGRIDGLCGADAVAAVAETYLGMVQGPDPVSRVHLVVWGEAVAGGADKRPYRVTWDRYFRTSLATLIRGGIADGSIRDDLDPDAVAVVVVGLLRGVALQFMLDPTSGNRAGALGTVTGTLDAMLRPSAVRASA